MLTTHMPVEVSKSHAVTAHWASTGKMLASATLWLTFPTLFMDLKMLSQLASLDDCGADTTSLVSVLAHVFYSVC